MTDQDTAAQAGDDADAAETRALAGDGTPIDGTRKNDDGTVTLFLERPITVMRNQVDELTIKRPRGREMRGLDTEKGAIAASLKYLAVLANIPPPCVDLLDAADIKAAGDVLQGFMRKTRVAGGN